METIRKTKAHSVDTKCEKTKQLEVEVSLLREGYFQLNKTKAALEESEKKFRSIFEGGANGILIADVKTKKFTMANRAICDFLGYSENELVRLGLSDIHPKSSYPWILKQFMKQARGAMRVFQDCPCLRKDGSVVYADISAASFVMGGIRYNVGFFRDTTDRKRAEDMLREDEQKLREAQKLAHLGHWHWDIKTGRVEWSDEIYKIFRLNPKKFIPNIDSILALSPWPEDHKRDQELIERAMKSHASGSYEQKFLRPDKSIGYYSSTFRGNYDKKGKLLSIDGIVMDITERKKSEEESKELTQRQKSILGAVPDIIMEVNRNKVYTWANQAGIDFFGKDVVGKKASDFFEGIQNTYITVRPIFSGDEKTIYLESWQRRKDGQRRLLAWRCKTLKNKDGKVIGALSSAQDITEHKQAQEALRESELKYRGLYESLHDAFARVNMDGTLVEFNDHFKEMLGYSEEELLKSKYTDITPKKWRAAEAKIIRSQVLKRGYSEVYQKEYRRKDGRLIPIELRTFLLTDSDGAPQGMWAIVRDITERKNAEETIANLASFPMQNPNPIIRIRPNGEVLYENDSARKHFKNLSASLYRTIKPKVWKAFQTNRILEVEIDVGDRYFLLSITPFRHLGYLNLYARDITSRKQAEALLSESERRVKELVETANSVILRWTPDGIIRYINEYGYKLFGYTNGDLIGKNVLTLVPKTESTGRNMVGYIKDIAIHPSRYALTENENIRKNGERFWVSWTNKVIRDAEGDVREILAIGNDITERMKIQARLSQSENRYHSLFVNMQEGFAYCQMIYDKHGKPEDFRYLMVNPAFAKLTGLRDVTGKKVTEAIPGIKKTNPELFRIYDRVATTGKPETFEAFSPSFGGWLAVSAFRPGEKGYFVAVFDNVTKRKESEMSIKASEVRYRRLFESAKDGIMILDFETGMVVDSNPFLSEILGIPRIKLIGKQLWQLGVFKDILLNKSTFLEMKRKKIVRYENLPLQTSDGRKGYIEFISYVYEAGDKKVIHCNIRDVTERRKSEELREQFLNTTTHELKSPLIPIRSQSQLLLDGNYGSMNDKQRAAVEMILRNEDHLERLVTDILDISRARSRTLRLVFEKTDFSKVARKAVKHFVDIAESKKIALVLKISPKLPPLSIDSKRIVQVIGNLISNAIKNTPENGTISMTTNKTKAGIQVSIQDTGIGMDKGVSKQLFTPFFQADKTTARRLGGVGLGLAICKGIVEAHGGKIWGESPGINKGSVFTFTLPLKKRR